MNLPLAAEALVATGGLFRAEPLGPADARAAAELPRDWQEHVVAILDEKRRPGRPPKAKQVDYLHTWDKLKAQRDDRPLVMGMNDEQVGLAYLEALRRARGYLEQQWRPMSMDTLLGPKLLEPPLSEQQRASDLYATVAEPTTVLRDMAAGCLIGETAAAFRAVYPALAGMLDDMINAELLRRRTKARSYEAPWSAEQAIRVLRQMPAGATLAPLPTGAPKAPPKIDIAIKRQPSDLHSRAQSVAAGD